jgi:hypothetical protein
LAAILRFRAIVDLVAGGTAFLASFGLGAAFRAAFFATARTGLVRSFAAFVLVALFARALPAGERLVAGFRRVDFAPAFFAADDFTEERRATARDEDFFIDFAMGLLMFGL